VLAPALGVGLVLLVVLVLIQPIVAVVVALVAGVAVALLLRRNGPAVAARSLGGRPADPVADARLVNLVEGLCPAAGVPPPALRVLDDPAPNAAAYGLDPRSATVVVTTGLLEQLNRVELEGVLARELALIRTHDVVPATVGAAVLGTPLRLIGPLARLAREGAPAVVADAEGVAITRYPPGLAAALEKVRASGATVRAGSPATSHLWVVPPGGAPAVHPPLEERIEALREL
jgi:heat shock protein HtpX